jgi:hypothetical protein
VFPDTGGSGFEGGETRHQAMSSPFKRPSSHICASEMLSPASVSECLERWRMSNKFDASDMDDRLADLLADIPAALASSDAARQKQILDELSEICLSRGPRAAAVPLLIT